MSTKLMEEENTVYEIDEECMQQKEQKRKEKTEEEIYQGLRCEDSRKGNKGVWILILYLLVCRS